MNFILFIIGEFVLALIICSFVWVVAKLFGAEWEYWTTLRYGVVFFIILNVFAQIIKSLSAGAGVDHHGGGTWRPPY